MIYLTYFAHLTYNTSCLFCTQHIFVFCQTYSFITSLIFSTFIIFVTFDIFVVFRTSIDLSLIDVVIVLTILNQFSIFSRRIAFNHSRTSNKFIRSIATCILRKFDTRNTFVNFDVNNDVNIRDYKCMSSIRKRKSTMMTYINHIDKMILFIVSINID